MVMRVLGQHYLDSNPGSKIQVIGYGSRPILKLTPPAKSKDPRVQTMNYIECVRMLPIAFSPDELEPILREIKPKWYGKVRSLFIVLNDDMIKKKFRSRSHPAPVQNTDTESEATVTSGAAAAVESVSPMSVVSSRSDTSDRSDHSSRSQRPEKTHKSKSGGSRSQKRGASPSAPSVPEKHRK